MESKLESKMSSCSMVIHLLLPITSRWVIACNTVNTTSRRSLNSLHIQYVFECLNKNTKAIYNIKTYLLATLFNAPATISNYYDARVRYDFSH